MRSFGASVLVADDDNYARIRIMLISINRTFGQFDVRTSLPSTNPKMRFPYENSPATREVCTRRTS